MTHKRIDIAARPTRWANVLLLATALAAVGPAVAAEQSSACDDALVVRQWQAYQQLMGGSPTSDAATAPWVARLRALVAWQKAVVSATAPDSDAQAIEHKLWDALRSYDLDALYKALPNAQPPWRSVDFRGQLAGDNYRISLAQPADLDTPLAALGDTRSDIAMRPKTPAPNGPGGDHYEIRARWRADIGAIGWTRLRAAQATGLNIFVVPSPIAAPLADQASAARANPNLARSDQPIMAQLWAGYPASWAWYASVGRVNSLRAGTAKSTAGSTASAGDRQHMHLDFALDDPRLARRYPAVAAYFQRLGNVITAHTVISNPLGTWLVLDMDSAQRRIQIDGWLDNGQLVPSRHGVPVASYTPGAPLDKGSFTSISDLHMRAFGITMTLAQLPMHWSYRRDVQGAHFVGLLHDKPKVSVTGRAFGIIPAGVVEGLMPVNISDFVDDFMTVLIASNNDQGARIGIDFADQASGDNRLAVSGDADTLDNFFIHFGVRMINSRVLPSAKALAGLRHMIGDGLDAFDQDLDARARIATASTCSR